MLDLILILLEKINNNAYVVVGLIVMIIALSGADNLYKSYSIHGAKAKPGNFFTYINHAKEVFGEDELIDRDLKNHIP